MERYGWLLDPKLCIECRACESACKQWNNVEIGVGVRYRRVKISEMGTYPSVTTQAISGACNHCETAWCMKACPVKAISRKDATGAVVIDTEKCVGCTQCKMFCPYDAPQINRRTWRMEKCTMCFDRVEQGLETACASLCPTHALVFGKWDDIKNKGVAQIPGFANPNQTQPHIRFITDAFETK